MVLKTIIRDYRAWIALGVIVAGVVFGVRAFTGAGGPSEMANNALAAEPAVCGPLNSTVAASGRLKPVAIVQVGSQVTGQVQALYADFNDEVNKGDILAQLDPAPFQAKLREAEAQLQVARATVEMNKAALEAARADIRSAQALYEEARLDLKRKRRLAKDKIISKSDIERAQAKVAETLGRVESTKARLSELGAQLSVSKARVQQHEATVRQRRIDLEYALIRSPVDGMVIERKVSAGQTLSANLETPTLFVIAENMRQMQIEASVDEADVGNIYHGQKVRFSVDAFPSQRFNGTVKQVRMAPNENSNVVTYTVIVNVDNSHQKFFSGMTANAEFVVSERQHILKVPNTALRFTPPPFLVAGAKPPTPSAAPGATGDTALTGDLPDGLKPSSDEAVEVAADSTVQTSPMMSPFANGSGKPVCGATIKKSYRDKVGRTATVWVMDKDSNITPRQVVVGLTDGRFTEVLSGPLAPGERVATGMDMPFQPPGL